MQFYLARHINVILQHLYFLESSLVEFLQLEV